MQIYVNHLVQFGEKALKLNVFKFQKGLKMLSQGESSEKILKTIGQDVAEFSMRTGIQRDALGSFWSRLRETTKFGFKKLFGRPFIKYEDDCRQLLISIHELGHAIAAKVALTPVNTISIVKEKYADATVGGFVQIDKHENTTKNNIFKNIFICLSGHTSDFKSLNKLVGEKIYSLFLKKGAEEHLIVLNPDSMFMASGKIKDANDIVQALQDGKQKGYFPKLTSEMLKHIPFVEGNAGNIEEINAIFQKFDLPYVSDLQDLTKELFDRIPKDKYQKMLSELRQRGRISSWSIHSFFKRHDLGWTELQRWFNERLERLAAEI